MSYYFDSRAPAVPQWRTSRSGKFVSAILVHDTESTADTTGPDTGAEAVANFIRTRKNAGSYHVLVDGDSILPLMPGAWQAFHCVGGVNQWTLGLSFACRTVDWTRMPAEYLERMLRNGAKASAQLIRWIESGQPDAVYPKAFPKGSRFPVRWITGEEARAGYLGITTHAQMDPARRTDPGKNFPGDRYLAMVKEELEALRGPEKDGDDMAKSGSVEIGVNVQAGLWGFPAALDVIRALYAVHRPSQFEFGSRELVALTETVQNGAEIASWGRDLAARMAKGEDPGPVLEYIAYALRQEFEGKPV